MKNLIVYISIAFTVVSVMSCSNDDATFTGSGGLRVAVNLCSIGSRATGGVDMSADKGFGSSDVVGLFSTGGNMDPGSDGKLVNIPMKFDYSLGDNGYIFINESVNADPSQLGKVFLYYPYKDGIDTAEGVSIVDENNDLVYDFLTASHDWGGGYRFEHAFSKLRITCSEGFDKVSGQKVTVCLSAGSNKVRVVDNPKGNDPFKVYELTGTVKEFTAQAKMSADGTQTKNVYEVILPCSRESLDPWDKVKVDYVKLTDNGGIEHKLHLSHELFEKVDENGNPIEDNWGYLKPNCVFPITIKMENLQPTVRGGNIIAWGEDEKITIEREYGISESRQFDEWYQLYNDFITEYPTIGNRPSPEEISESKEYEKLRSYGKYTNRRWNFHIESDLDLSECPRPGSVYIRTLCDTLSGSNHVLSNIKLSGAGNGFIGTIEEGGCVRDLRLSSLSVDAQAGAVSGTMVSRMAGGSVTNCRITGISMRCEDGVVAGAFAGEMTGGTLSHCTFQGAVMGAAMESTGVYHGILGKNPENPDKVTITEIDASNVIIR